MKHEQSVKFNVVLSLKMQNKATLPLMEYYFFLFGNLRDNYTIIIV